MVGTKYIKILCAYTVYKSSSHPPHVEQTSKGTYQIMQKVSECKILNRLLWDRF